MAVMILAHPSVGVRAIAKLYVERRGHSMLTASSAGAALALTMTQRPDVLLCDPQLPGGGAALVRCIQNRWKGVQAILWSDSTALRMQVAGCIHLNSDEYPLREVLEYAESLVRRERKRACA